MKKQGSEKAPGKWKTIRVRRESLDLMHAAIRDYSCPAYIQPPWWDDDTANDSRAADIACRLASEQITGKLSERQAPEMQKAAADIYHLALVRVAALFKAAVVICEDGSVVIYPPGEGNGIGEGIDLPGAPEMRLPRVPSVLH